MKIRQMLIPITSSCTERELARYINNKCYSNYKNGLDDIINTFWDKLVKLEELTSNTFMENERIASFCGSAKKNTYFRILHMLGVYNYLLASEYLYQETFSKRHGYYIWTINIWQPLGIGMSTNIDTILNYCFRLLTLIGQQANIDLVVEIERKLSRLVTTINYHPFSRESTMRRPIYWLDKNYPSYYYIKDVNQVINRESTVIRVNTNKIEIANLWPDEILSNSRINPNLTILEVFHYYGYQNISEDTANDVWTRWSQNIMWLRKRHVCLPLGLVNRDMATIIQEYDTEDNLYFYSEFSELLLLVTNLPINLQHLICCYI